ncbi:MAG: UDP-glucose dehydrogenase family protein [Desulfocucumaceae bacterium]
MRICVYGLWHLGSVTAACLSGYNFKVCGLDLDQEVTDRLNKGISPLFEPGLEETVKEGLSEGSLTFTSDPVEALNSADYVWVTYDTPVDDDDNADVEFVADKIRYIFPYLNDGAFVIISSQVPVGFTRKMEKLFAREYPDKKVSFAYSPENLRLGKAVDTFKNPGRIIIGLRKASDLEKVRALLEPVCPDIISMKTESAEMTKHAINAFLATSVAFANELAVICEKVGADAREVEQGLKSETRIGPGAYLSPGTAFSGGTLSRDILFLSRLSADSSFPAYLIDSVRQSNNYHREWIKRKLIEVLPSINGKNISVLGLTYKPGTDTLRRSQSVELCRWLADQKANVFCFDPLVKSLPDDLRASVSLSDSIESSIRGSDCIVLSTEWPDFKQIDADIIVECMSYAVVIDPKGFLQKLARDERIRYFSVGRGNR